MASWLVTGGITDTRLKMWVTFLRTPQQLISITVGPISVVAPPEEKRKPEIRRVRRLSARHLPLRTLTPSKWGTRSFRSCSVRRDPGSKITFVAPSGLFWPKNKVEPAAHRGLPPRCASKVTQKIWTTPRSLFFFNTLKWVCFTYTWSTALSHCQEPKWNHYGSCHCPMCGDAWHECHERKGEVHKDIKSVVLGHSIISNNTILSLCFSAGGRALQCIEQSSNIRERRFFKDEL